MQRSEDRALFWYKVSNQPSKGRNCFKLSFSGEFQREEEKGSFRGFVIDAGKGE